MTRKRKRSSVTGFETGVTGFKTDKIPQLKIPSLSLGTTKPKRDKRRAFTATQKKEILYQQDGKCAKCHKKLDPRATQFDHKKPWASGGRTKTQNGRALCSDCHSIVTHKERLRKTDRKRKPKDPFSLF
jgi:5-methylcytosine-specific restriction endonuclease McrA